MSGTASLALGTVGHQCWSLVKRQLLRAQVQALSKWIISSQFPRRAEKSTFVITNLAPVHPGDFGSDVKWPRLR